jgi:hypothetical protein
MLHGWLGLIEVCLRDGRYRIDGDLDAYYKFGGIRKGIGNTTK